MPSRLSSLRRDLARLVCLVSHHGLTEVIPLKSNSGHFARKSASPMLRPPVVFVSNGGLAHDFSVSRHQGKMHFYMK